MSKIYFKKLHDEAVEPSKAHYNDASYDMVAVSKKVAEKYIQYGTGIALHIPDGMVGLIFPRSSVTKTDLMLKNCVGVIDAGYRGEVSFRFGRQNYDSQIYKIDVTGADDTQKRVKELIEKYKIDPNFDSIQFSTLAAHKQDEEVMSVYNEYNVGDRIGQIIFLKLPEVTLEETDTLDDSERGDGSYGSTGK